MNLVIQFLIEHGYTLLFLWMFAEQVGLPLPAAPLLLAVGALAGDGKMSFSLAFGLAALASLLTGILWYQIGRRGGSSVLSFLCRISLNPDSCVRQTADLFTRHGTRLLLVARFIPGINTVIRPLGGIFRMGMFRFLLFDGLGAVIWVAFFIGLGFLFSHQIEETAEYALKLGSSLLGVLIGGLAAFILWKYAQRRRALRQLGIARITPEELKHKLDDGENLMILDVRHRLEFEAEPKIIPGAFHLPLEEMEKDILPFPRDREIILYCN